MDQFRQTAGSMMDDAKLADLQKELQNMETAGTAVSLQQFSNYLEQMIQGMSFGDGGKGGDQKDNMFSGLMDEL
jgi:hypothetical protein